jgi:ABC-type antimicrobial peptide transport system permease subunit
MLLVVDVRHLVPTNITIGIPIQNFSMFSRTTSIRLEGVYPTSDDQIVVGNYLATVSGLAVGSTVKVDGVSLNVSGIISTSNLILANAVIMPLQTAQQALGYSGLVSAILVSSKGVRPDTVIQTINSTIPGVVAIDPALSESFTSPLVSSIGTITYSIDVFSIALAFLFVTIITSVNIMEQKEEFYTMRAIGSSSGSILKVTLAETGFISTSGFVLGLVFSAVAIAAVFQTYASVPFSASLSSTTTLLPLRLALFAGLVVVAFGMLVGGITMMSMLRKLK